MNAARHYCTYFDSNYLVQGLTLYRSLAEHDPRSVLWVLCLDQKALDAIKGLDRADLRPVALAELEQADPEVAATKERRSRVEYYFTISPAWPAFLLRRHPDIDRITYLDSDLLFFSTPDPIFDEMGNESVLIIEHGFPDHLRDLERHGRFNVGLLAFRNDKAGRDVLSRWRLQCIEWCYDRVEDGKFADQRYLDAWPNLPGVHVLRHKGAGLAPWNWMNYRVQRSNAEVDVDDEPLIFFHYQGFRYVNRWLFRTTEPTYDAMPGRLRRLIYGPYVRALRSTRRWLRACLPSDALPPQGAARYAALSRQQILSGLRRGYIHPRLGPLAF